MNKLFIGGMTLALLASCVTEYRVELDVKQVPYKSVFLLRASDPLSSSISDSSAVAIKVDKVSEGWQVLFLTCLHSVKVGSHTLNLYILGNGNTDFPRTNHNTSYAATIISMHPTRDLALISSVLDKEVEVASLTDNIPVLGQRVYTVGYPMGANLSITEGFISDFHVNMNRYVSTAPAFFGSSGGAIFDKDTGKLVGVLCNVYMYAANSRLPSPGIVANMTLFESLSDTLDWRELWQSQRS